MQFKFKVREIVKIKPLKEILNTDSGPGFVPEMKELIGKKVKIVGRHDSSFTSGVREQIYTIGGWNWKEEWLAKVEFFNDKDFEI